MSYIELKCIKESILFKEYGDELTVPLKYKKIKIQDKKVVIENDNDFFNAMECFRFHMINNLPFEIYDYVRNHEINLDDYKDFFYKELTLLRNSELSNVDTNIKKQKIQIMSETPKCGFLNLLKYAHSTGIKWNHDSITLAIQNNQIECLKYAVENGCPLNNEKDCLSAKSSCTIAAMAGNLEILKYLRCVGASWNEYTMYYAARHGYLDVLKYLHNDNAPVDPDICSAAACSSHECLKFLHKSGHNLNDQTILNASTYGIIECLKYVHENGCLITEQCFENAALYNNIECLKYLYQKQPMYHHRFCSRAAAADSILRKNKSKTEMEMEHNTSLECLQFLHEMGCPWTAQTCVKAAQNDNLKCLKYAYENGCELNAETVFMSARNSFDCLEYVYDKFKVENVNEISHEQHCYHEELCIRATQNAKNLKFIFNRITKYNESHKPKINMSLWSNRISFETALRPELKLAVEFGCPLSEQTFCAAMNSVNSDTLKYLYEKKCPIPDTVCEYAATRGYLECLKYLHEIGCEWNKDTFVSAARNGHRDCIEYAIKNGCECDKNILEELEEYEAEKEFYAKEGW